jgi:succinate dehydrogenase/fumarate reductase flavoprotein subunit
VHAALQGKQNTLTFDNEPKAGSNNVVTSGGIHAALAGKQSDLTQVPVVTSLQETDFLFLERAGAIYKIRASAVIIPSGDTGDVVETESGDTLLTEDGQEILIDTGGDYSDAVTTESGEQLLTEGNEIINID